MGESSSATTEMGIGSPSNLTVKLMGTFLEVVEYQNGERRGMILIPEGRDKKGWEPFISKAKMQFMGQIGQMALADGGGIGRPHNGWREGVSRVR